MRNEPAQAVAVFRRVLQFEPKSEKAHVSLGLLYLDMGEKDLVLSEYRALQASGSSFAPYLLNEINARASVATMR
ncbi:MAG: hypothetical protein A2X58_07355 [Nitrospirae bacterium GWC2_56_14]|nr:MAG: hypothetical protein A2X58_07355 [Nitrospirae bacterium GWC2_56_14]